MLIKIDNGKKHGNSHIAVLYPGEAMGMSDSGIGSIGRIDQANIHAGTTIKMHPHINDEILSYFRVGKVIHSDSAGQTATIGRNKLMLMRAGKVFYHEEKIIDGLEGLQIFIRPKQANDAPTVEFHELITEDSINGWRQIAGNTTDSHLRFTSETAIYDCTINNDQQYELPQVAIDNAVFLLYVFQGSIILDNNINLSKGESVVTDQKIVSFGTKLGAELVLFVTNAEQDCFKGGMFSGNQL
jgi:quercetin 2,3-dioxygenase